MKVNLKQKKYDYFYINLFSIFSSATSSDFPEIYGCFCEGGIISGRLKDKKDIIIIDEKKLM